MATTDMKTILDLTQEQSEILFHLVYRNSYGDGKITGNVFKCYGIETTDWEISNGFCVLTITKNGYITTHLRGFYTGRSPNREEFAQWEIYDKLTEWGIEYRTS